MYESRHIRTFVFIRNSIQGYYLFIKMKSIIFKPGFKGILCLNRNSALQQRC